MRTIKFRGKRVDNGGWVYGDLLRMHGVPFVYPDPAPNGWNDYTVIPDTVSQFTGLLDKNGKDIYEGDVVRTLSGFVGYVRYNERFMRYEVAGAGESYDNDRNPDGVPLESWEVLGNIHDNPELMKQND